MAETICSECCGREREVSIDCPSDCPHLVASRQYDAERREIDWKKMPYPETPIRGEFVDDHKELIDTLAFAICQYAAEKRFVVDSDVRGAVDALAGTYRTLASGIYYEQPPDSPVERELYGRLKEAIEQFKKGDAQHAIRATRDSEIRNALVFLVQLAYIHDNGRPKCRALLDLLRREFAPGQFDKPASNIVLLP